MGKEARINAEKREGVSASAQKRPTCETCKHCWLGDGGAVQCRKKSPSSELALTPQGPAWFTNFPTVKLHWGCGEFEADLTGSH